jgi:FkbM family methyltransferase
VDREEALRDMSFVAESSQRASDDPLLARSRTQWQFGDWDSLAELHQKQLACHPDRAKLALMGAAGRIQIDDMVGAKELIGLAETWGCDRSTIARVLIAGVYTSLARAELLRRNSQRANDHTHRAISITTPNADMDLIAEARAVRESARLGLLPQAAELMNRQMVKVRRAPDRRLARVRIVEAELDLLNQELSLAQQRNQLYASPGDISESGRSIDGDPKARLERVSASQLGQDLWVAEKTGYKRKGFFVEFGATDGVLLSNTWSLERELGWEGICAEPNPHFLPALRRNRQCRVSDAFIGPRSGEKVEFILAGVFGGSSEFADKDAHIDKREAYRSVGEVINVESVSLNDFLLINRAPREIDYMSIDTEGSEFDLLSTFPFDEWNIKLFTIEHNFTDQREKIRDLLKRNGYAVTESRWDDWYEKK